MQDRVMIFIDGQNLLHSAQQFSSGYKIDLIKLRDYLIGDRKLIRAYYYGSIPSEDEERITAQKKFYHFLEYSGFTVYIRPLSKREYTMTCEECGHTKKEERYIEKGVDIALSTDMLSLGFTGSYDVGILVAGDLDYIKTIEVLKQRGVIIEIACFKSTASGELIRSADKYIPLDEIAEKIRR